MLLDFPQSIAFWTIAQASPVCPSGNSNKQMEDEYQALVEWLSYTEFTDLFFNWKHNILTERYELKMYILCSSILVFSGLIYIFKCHI
jgi:hypothetical protein